MKHTLKEKIKSKELTLGSWITLGHPSIGEIMGDAGFDWLTVDMEHSIIGLREAQSLIGAIQSRGVAPLVRVGENNANLIKRVMDAGAHGVIVPMVNTKEDARRAVEAVKYPPQGTRGVGLARAQGYGVGFESYRDWLADGSVVIVQIEHIKAVENLESILTVDGVDGFIVGPYDLSGSLGVPGDFNNPDMVEAMKTVKEVSDKLGALAGVHVIQPDPGEVKTKIDEGYRFIAYSLDTLFLATSCRSGLNSIREM
jgi:2-dehydro-3-deoxyglucarate aldolase